MSEGGSDVARWSTESGVPVFALPSGRTPSATLYFRAGFADETLATSGWLHLLEHLAVHSSEHADVRCNAAVGLCLTEFSVTGRETDVLRFLGELSTWLAEPSFEHLPHEIAIVQAEYAQRPVDDVATHLGLRFGPRRHGLPAFHTFGLRRATEQELAGLARRFFVAGNAALALNFLPAHPLQLPLRSGSAQLPPAAEQLPLPVPALAGGVTPFVATSGLLRRSSIAPLVAATIRDATQQLLRGEMGASYATTVALDRLDSETLLLCLSSDVAPHGIADSVQLLHENLVKLAEDGVSTEQLSRVRDQLLWSFDDDPSGAWQASRCAVEHLYGTSTNTALELRRELEEVSTSDLDDEVHAYLSSVLYTSPAADQSSALFPRVEPANPPSKGKHTTFEPWDPRVPARLTISPGTAVMEVVPTGRAARSLEDATGLLKHPGGSRTIVAADGGTLHVDPAAWLNGDAAVALLDSYVPEQHHIDLEADPGAVPFEPPSWARRQVRAMAAMLATSSGILVVLLILFPLVLLALLTIPTYGRALLTGWLVLVARCVYDLVNGDR